MAGSAFDALWGDRYIWVFSLVFTFLVLFGTEIAPKVIGVSYNGLLAPVLLRPLQLVIMLLRPLIFVTDIVSRFLKGGRTHGGAEIDAADLITQARLAGSGSLIDQSQEQIIVNATKLQQSTAETVFFQMAHSTEGNLDIARQNLHTRYPVSETEHVDGIVGYVNFKEIFAIDPEDRENTLHSYLRHNIDVLDSDRLSDVMRRLISTRRHLAMVRDDSGRTLGMLTLEDVLEEIDIGPTDLVNAGRGRWKVGGGVSIGGLARISGEALDAPAETRMADYLEDRLGRLKKPGGQVRVDGWTFAVLQVRRRRAYSVLAEKS